jgi:hypothetical protein
MQNVIMIGDVNSEVLGALPSFVNPEDDRPAAEQFNENYAHGGGWKPIEGFMFATVQMEDGNDTVLISYPGDPPMVPIALMYHGDEVIMFFPHE